MPTATQIREDRAFVESQGFSVEELFTARPSATWYKLDGKAIPNLPTDMYHRTLYRQRGWTLIPPGPKTQPNLPIATVSETIAASEEKISPPPKHLHVYRVEQGSPCLVLGCTSTRKHAKSAKQSHKRGRETANE